MNIDKYIKWGEIWNDEVSLVCIDDNNTELISIITKFINDKGVTLMVDECYIDDDVDELIFFFGEDGGQNESDTQGWFRIYRFVVGSDFEIIDAEYTQG